MHVLPVAHVWLTKVCPAHAPVTASRSSRIILYLNAEPHNISTLCIKFGSPTHLQALGDVAVGARRVAAQVAFEQHAIRLVILHTRHEESVQAFKLEASQYKLVHPAYTSDGESSACFWGSFPRWRPPAHTARQQGVAQLEAEHGVSHLPHDLPRQADSSIGSLKLAAVVDADTV